MVGVVTPVTPFVQTLGGGTEVIDGFGLCLDEVLVAAVELEMGENGVKTGYL